MLERSLRPTLWPTLGYGVKCPMGASSRPLLPETQALLFRMEVQPDTSRKRLIDKTIRQLKADGIWPLLGFLHIQAAHHSQAGLLDWTGNRYDCTAVNGPVFTVDRGYTGDGATTRIHPIALPWIEYANTPIDSISYGAFGRATTATNAVFVGRSANSGAGIIYKFSEASTILMYGHGGVFATVPVVPFAFYALTKSPGGSMRAFLNGAFSSSATMLTQTTPIGFNYLWDSFRLSSNYTVSGGFISKELTDTQHAALYATLNNYMQEVGNV